MSGRTPAPLPTEDELAEARRFLADWEHRKTPEDHQRAIECDKMLELAWNRRPIKPKRVTF